MDCLFEGVLRKPGLIPGRKTKVWCILDGKELIFYRENKRSSCIGSEDLAEIRSIQRVDGSDQCDFQIVTETKSTIYSAENGTACEQWILHIKEALGILGINVCTENVKVPVKERIDIPKSPDKSVHSLMQLWQQGPNSSVNRNRKQERTKSENKAKNTVIESVPPVNHMKCNSGDIEQSLPQNKDPDITANGSKFSRTDSGYETIPSDKRNSDHKLETVPFHDKNTGNANKTECSGADVILNSKEVLEKFDREDQEGNRNIDSVTQEIIQNHADTQRVPLRKIVSVEIKDEGMQEVDITNVTYRRKSRPSVMDSSLSFDENSNESDSHLMKSSKAEENHGISQAEVEKEELESESGKGEEGNPAMFEEKGITSHSNSESTPEYVTTRAPEEDEPPVMLRKRSVANDKDTSIHKTVDVTVSVTAPEEEEEEEVDVVDGDFKDDDLNVDDFEEFLNDLTFEPLPELAPLKLYNISESLSGIADLITEGNSRSSLRSAIKSQTGDELAQLKEMLNTT